LGTAVHDPRTVQRPLAEAYRAAAANPRYAIVRAVFPAKDRETARDDLAPALDVHRANFAELSRLSAEEHLARINVHLGATEEAEPGRLYRDLVERFAAAEELGYESGWVAQHHFQPEHGRLPAPLVLLAAAADRTSRIRLGTAVTVLPLEDPLRLAEDVLVLD